MTTSRRLLLQATAALGFSSGKARSAPRGVYESLGIRPLINFQGTMTTIGASKMSDEVNAAMAEASRHYVVLEELKDAVGKRLAELCTTPAALPTSGASGAISLGTYACLTGADAAKIRRLPDLAGMKTEAVIFRKHRNGYDHAVRSAGLKIVEVETLEDLASALTPNVAMMYYLGGTSHDWELEPAPPIEQCLAVTRKAGVPMLVDAANMLPAWGNVTRLAELGVDLIALSGGKHIRGPQSSGILAGRRDLVDAAWLNSSPHSDSLGRPMKVNREEMIGLLVAVERYAKLDFDALDREYDRQSRYLIAEFRRLGLTAEKLPFDRTRRVHRVWVHWDEAARGMTAQDVAARLREGEPRIVVQPAKKGLEFTCFMNDPGDEKIAAGRMGEIFGG